MITFIIGGCKSGKSRHALELAHRFQTSKKIFIATGVAFDDEMKERIRRHQNERRPEWKTIEAPIKPGDAVQENSGKEAIILVDCLTFWINNLLMENLNSAEISDQADLFIQNLLSAEGPVIVVSNEVGEGIVPESPLARRFRDLAGAVNQKMASCADQVIWMVAGIPVLIKPQE